MVRKVLIDARNNKSQSDVASEIGISQQFLSGIEQGKKTPSIDVMKKIEDYYKKPMIELFNDVF